MPFVFYEMNKQTDLWDICRLGQLILFLYPLRSPCALGNPISSPWLTLYTRTKWNERRKLFYSPFLQSPLSGSSKYNEHKLNCETCLSKTNANLFKNNQHYIWRTNCHETDAPVAHEWKCHRHWEIPPTPQRALYVAHFGLPPALTALNCRMLWCLIQLVHPLFRICFTWCTLYCRLTACHF